jgi:uncharacterized caspase-like protein/opacity protein-like surface antigen
VRRLALVAAANSGAPTRARLRFATTDADRFATTLRQMGGVAEPDCVVLREPTRRALLDALAVLRDDVRRAQAFARRTEVLFYFSGHADEEGLQLGRERISYPELREALAAVPSDVRIAILDACSSGAITRFKGGRMQPAFLSDVSSEVRGQAFLTSSSAAEAAQESDHLQGSFFTNALVSGLRGAADASGDGKVTLNEAYEFAFDETLARTAATQGGSQHPTYDIRMAGSGDVVLTDLRETRAAIVIGPELDGRFFVRDASGRLVAELGKPKGRTTELGVEPGAYEVEYEQGSTQLRARIQVAEGERRPLGRPEMQAVRRKPTRLRGGPVIDPWSAGGRSRVELHLGGSQLSASSSATATGTSGQVSGAAFDLGYAYGLRKDLWLDLRLVALNLDVADRVDSLSGPETRTRGTYGALLGVRAFAPIAGSVRPFGLLGVGVATDFVSVDSLTSSDFKSSNAGIALQAGGGVEVRIGSHASLDLALLYTGHEGSSGAGISLGFGWTMGHPR